MQLRSGSAASNTRGWTAHTALQQFVSKLERRLPLDAEDRDILLALPVVDRTYVAGETIVDQDIRATHCAFIAKGMVSRIKHLDGQHRQIVALHLAGDAIDLQSILFTRVDHTIYAHSKTEVSWVAHAEIIRTVLARPSLARLIWLDTLVDASIYRTWTANIGRRNAQKRTAHLFLEMAARLDAIGELDGDSYEFPLTQSAMADALGLSLVHMNKSLRALRDAGYLETRKRTVDLRDREGLIAFAGFDDGYLYLDNKRIKALPHVS